MKQRTDQTLLAMVALAILALAFLTGTHPTLAAAGAVLVIAWLFSRSVLRGL